MKYFTCKVYDLSDSEIIDLGIYGITIWRHDHLEWFKPHYHLFFKQKDKPEAKLMLGALLDHKYYNLEVITKARWKKAFTTVGHRIYSPDSEDVVIPNDYDYDFDFDDYFF